jgi:predicted dithiol-disulfide oxidoreductase (DUF899 family)
MLWAVSRAPLAKLQAYKQRMRWTFPWASAQDTEFNFDFNVSYTAEQQRAGIEYNFSREPMRAEWTVSGQCISGSTVLRKGGMRPAFGGGVTTSTAHREHRRLLDRGVDHVAAAE